MTADPIEPQVPVAHANEAEHAGGGEAKSSGGWPSEEGWRDIAGAPKDGTFVLLWSPDGENNPWIGHWRDDADYPDGGAWWQDNESGFPVDADPAYWQPLPPPPQSAVRGDGSSRPFYECPECGADLAMATHAFGCNRADHSKTPQVELQSENK